MCQMRISEWRMRATPPPRGVAEKKRMLVFCAASASPRFVNADQSAGEVTFFSSVSEYR